MYVESPKWIDAESVPLGAKPIFQCYSKS